MNAKIQPEWIKEEKRNNTSRFLWTILRVNEYNSPKSSLIMMKIATLLQPMTLAVTRDITF
jgi:hypothetical protein